MLEILLVFFISRYSKLAVHNIITIIIFNQYMPARYLCVIRIFG